MKKNGLNPPKEWVKLPRGMMSSSREEYETELTIKEGALPTDIGGYWMFVAPAESPDTTNEKLDGNPVFAGDGMIYRINLNGKKPILKTKLAKPPSLYADEETSNPDSPYANLKFKTNGIGRLSFQLGMREDLNTTFFHSKPQKTPKPAC